MEVLENSSHLKDPENQNPASNFGCRLPRDLNPGTAAIARSKAETDIGRLVACKAQLSSEVIRWKTESLKLQKERDAARQKVRELDQNVLRLSQKAKELETQLLLSEQEKIQLRTKSLIAGDCNAHLIQKLSQNFEKYHSFPWTDTPAASHNVPSTLYSSCKKSQEVPLEDWKQVSHKIMEKMKQEMKELQELGSHCSAQDKDSAAEVEGRTDIASDEELEETVSNLLSDASTLKHCLLDQQNRLKRLFNSCTSSNIVREDFNVRSDSKSVEASRNKPLSPKCKPPTNFSRPSDDSFRDYFTKQLEGLHEVDKMTKAMQIFLQTEETRSRENKTNIPESKSSGSNIPRLSDTVTGFLEDRVCPICEAPFAANILQKDFEEHVLDHLEAESASLLDQYVVL
ncbi:uncharacterized protein LOC129221188 [Uloborus diversus]|uniref:uncharacterized protein LOC129221188 n=1 Tax=Uloborus diversus TaxID=327109 RepID=UPI00240A0B57|nr:uncharacterized protein LOC129221188 [Uloborus diversus]